MIYYTTVGKLRDYLSLSDTEVEDDEKLNQYIVRASQAIKSYTRRGFTPERRTLFFDTPSEGIHIRDFDLLEVKGLSDQALTRGFNTSSDTINLMTGS